MLNRVLFSSIVAAFALTCVNGASAQITTTDSTAARIPGSAPTPISAGVHDGFGGQIGVAPDVGAVNLEVDSDSLGRVSMRFLNGYCGGYMASNDVGVIYIDSTAGGFADTSGFTDVSSAHTAAISAGASATGGGSNISSLGFPIGFRPDFAIAFESRDPFLDGIPTTASL